MSALSSRCPAACCNCLTLDQQGCGTVASRPASRRAKPGPGCIGRLSPNARRPPLFGGRQSSRSMSQLVHFQRPPTIGARGNNFVSNRSQLAHGQETKIMHSDMFSNLSFLRPYVLSSRYANVPACCTIWPRFLTVSRALDDVRHLVGGLSHWLVGEPPYQ